METEERMKGFNGQIAILVVIMALMVGVLLMSSRFAYTQAKLAPLAVSIIVLALAGAQLVKEPGKNANADAKAADTEKKGGALVSEAFWIGGFIVLIYLCGFYLAVPLFSLVYMKSHRAKWAPAISVSLMTLVFIYVVFIRILDFRLYPGLIMTMLERG
jgi:hypothetical protein